MWVTNVFFRATQNENAWNKLQLNHEGLDQRTIEKEADGLTAAGQLWAYLLPEIIASKPSERQRLYQMKISCSRFQFIITLILQFSMSAESQMIIILNSLRWQTRPGAFLKKLGVEALKRCSVCRLMSIGLRDQVSYYQMAFCNLWGFSAIPKRVSLSSFGFRIGELSAPSSIIMYMYSRDQVSIGWNGYCLSTPRSRSREKSSVPNDTICTQWTWYG